MSSLKITDLSEGLVDLSDDQIERINGGRTVTSSSSTTAFGNKEIARLENLAGVGNIPKFHSNPLMGTINPFNGANDNPLMGHEFQISSDIFANFKTFGKA
jgi:hypothetical protein